MRGALRTMMQVDFKVARRVVNDLGLPIAEHLQPCVHIQKLVGVQLVGI